MQSVLNEVIAGNIAAFLIIFMRFGMAMMIMPGIGDGFVPSQVRLLFAVAVSFVLTPVLAPVVPHLPDAPAAFVLLMLSEALIGIFTGTVMRVMIGALDTAGLMVSMQIGFSNAMIFNPISATQGSVVGALYSTLGVTLMLTANVHHFMLASVVESYRIFPAITGIPDIHTMADVIARAVSAAFLIGIEISMPFIIVGLLIQIIFGLLGRLMPQVQIFFLAMPVQIWLGLVMIAMTLSAGMMFWLSGYQQLVSQFLGL